jgi:excinuclease UvrABC helicase subunit UvrB
VELKVPTLVIYWADNRALLTHEERKSLEQRAVAVSITPREILLEMKGRKVVVVSIVEPTAPGVPSPRVV